MAVEFSVSTCVLLFYIFKIFKFTYSPHIKKNKLTKVPFIVVAMYMTALMTIYLIEFYCVVWMSSDFFEYCLATVVTYFWTIIILTTCFEWELITTLVKFQQSTDLPLMGIMKKKFNDVVEQSLLNKYVLFVILNTIYSVLKIVIPWIRIGNETNIAKNLVKEKILRRCDLINIVYLSILTIYMLYTLWQWSWTTY